MSDRSRSDEAIDWALRVAEPDFDDWEAFTMWLEADPAHGEAYEAVLGAGEMADAALLQGASSPADRPRPRAVPAARRWRWATAGGAVAAGLAAFASWMSLSPADPYLIETAPGARQRIALAGATIAVNGGTRIWLDHRNPRVATVERGEALFEVRHDAAHPFSVHVGDVELRDLGTRFDVTREGERVRVAVAEGAVMFNPGREAVRIDAGRELVADPSAGAAELHQTAVQTVGAWREGRFAYVRTPIATVAADLSRSTGLVLEVDPAVATKPFTGVITVKGRPGAFLADLGPLLGVDVTPGRGRWRLGQARTAD